MNRPKFVIRFDIDTVTCIKHGVPSLLEIADKYDIRFTFFANLGKSIDREWLLKNLLIQKSNEGEQPKKLNWRNKLTVRDLIRTMVLNPRLGHSFKEHYFDIYQRGHDIGLHGGKNHGTWHHCAHTFSLNRTLKHIRWGIDEFVSIYGQRPTSFSSPGWNTPKGLELCLKQEQFELYADAFNNKSTLTSTYIIDAPSNYSTTLLGQNGGVGFIEYIKAEKKTDQWIDEKITALFSSGSDIMMYDHPNVSGLFCPDTFIKVIETVISTGYQITTLQEYHTKYNDRKPQASTLSLKGY